MTLFILWNIGYILKGIIELKTEIELLNDWKEKGYFPDSPSIINLRKELKKEICDNKVLSVLLPFIPALKTDNYYINNVDDVIKKFDMRGLLGPNAFDEIERITENFFKNFDKELEKAKLDDKVLGENEENSSSLIDNHLESENSFSNYQKYEIDVGKNIFGRTDKYMVTNVLFGRCDGEEFQVKYGINKENELEIISSMGVISLLNCDEQKKMVCDILINQYEFMQLLFENDKMIYNNFISQSDNKNNHELNKSIMFYVTWLSELYNNRDIDQPKIYEYKK